MRRFGLLVVFLFIVGPYAAACSCGSGGTCKRVAGCGCAGHETMPTMPPAPDVRDDIVSLAVGAPSVAHVGVDNFFFTDSNVTIHVGDTVQWDWVAGFHTVTSLVGSGEQFDSGAQSAGSFSHTFATAGTFNYYCQFHGFDNGDGTASGMAAKVTVLPVPEPGAAAVASVLAAGGTLVRRRRRAN